jgi:hypothetical protein
VVLAKLRYGNTHNICAMILVSVVTLLVASCGPEDYQEPVKKFQDASQVVINATREFLNHENTVEENALIDQQVFEQKPIDPASITQVDVISPEEIKLRTGALDALAKYTGNLAQLAQGKIASDVGQDTKTLSDSLKKLSEDAKALPGAKGTVFDNKKFSGLASAAASAIGAVAQLIIEKKARHELEQAIVSNDAAVKELIQLISDDATLAFERQKTTLSANGVQLYNTYKSELLKKDKDPVLLLFLADRIKSFRSQEAVLPAANPAPAISAMEKAHSALVSYVQSNKNPHSLADLVKSVEDFLSAAQPLGNAIQALISASK